LSNENVFLLVLVSHVNQPC